jgi:hypothetical protein
VDLGSWDRTCLAQLRLLLGTWPAGNLVAFLRATSSPHPMEVGDGLTLGVHIKKYIGLIPNLLTEDNVLISICHSIIYSQMSPNSDKKEECCFGGPLGDPSNPRILSQCL